MIDRENVINALMCWRDAAAFQKWTGDCDSCAYANSKTGDCIDIAPIIDGAIDLLKADQTYLQEQDEKIKKLHLLLNAKLSAQPSDCAHCERLPTWNEVYNDRSRLWGGGWRP